MTDPFADLERELLAAHARRPRRDLRTLPHVLVATALVAAMVVTVGWLGASGDPERAAAPQQHDPPSGPVPERDPGSDDRGQPVEGCGREGWIPPRSQEPVPGAISSRMAIFRRPAGPDENTPDPRMSGRQARRLYADGRRTLPATGRLGVHAIAAEILPRARIGRPDDPCAAPEGAVEPGVCLVLTEKKGALSACFTMAEIHGGEAYIDVDGRIIGLAPDGARWAVSGGERAVVESNRFALPGDPATEVDFRP